jgi:hypothetical protein
LLLAREGIVTMANEHDSERETSAARLPSADAASAALEEEFLGPGPDCPFIGEVIAAAQGQADADVARKVSLHIRQCGYCLTCFQAYKEAWETPTTLGALPR